MASRRAALALFVVVSVLLVSLPPLSAASPPVLPVVLFGEFLGNLSMPALSPGQSGGVAFSVGDPLPTAITRVVLTLDVYEFNAYPGNATGPPPASGTPEFSSAGSPTGPSLVLDVGTLTPGGSAFISPTTVAVSVAAPANSPDGTYAVRFSLTFDANGSSYVLESRGFFSAAAWQSATSAPGGTSTLNVSRLGVSGVLPESAVLVRSNPFPLALALVLGGALVLAALGGYWALRRGPGSKSGATGGPPPNHADTAFGKRRSKDGD
ncbi:MAG: hypothetical protein L3K18_00665 [Thermoplasmata archaeon]|nr:hypothetical protein [Thermoplasmata archaeon]